MIGSQLISTLENDIRSLIVGKVFGSADLAFYDQGKKYPALLVTNVNSSINRVMLPFLSRKQDDLQELKKTLRRSVQLGVFIMAPLLLGLFSVADTFVLVVLTEKWIEIIPFLKIFCIIYLTRPVEELCHQTVLALGRSDIALIILAIINVVALIIVFVAVYAFESVLYIAVFSLVSAFVSTGSFLFAANRLIGYSFGEQLADMLPSLSIAALMGAAVSLMRLLPLSGIALLALQAFAGAVVYVLLSAVFRIKSLTYIWDKFGSRLIKKLKK